MESGLRGLTVWITGASGGIGWALARAFAAEGADLVLHAATRLAELEDRVAGTSWSARALCLAGDLRDPTVAERQVDAALARFGRVDVAIANAGIWPPEERPLWQMDPARIRDVIDVNLLGAMFTARAFLGALARTGPRADGRGANLILVGSTAGRFGEPGHSEYAVTKAGLRGLLLSLKSEIVRIDPYGRVNLVEPGWTVTEMARPTLDEPGTLPRVLATMPLRQLARPDDIATAALFLASPTLARHVSGEILTVAGGMDGRRLWTDAAIDPDEVRRRLDT